MSLRDEELERRIESSHTIMNSANENTGSAHYGLGGYLRDARAWHDQLIAEKQRREKAQRNERKGTS